MKIEVQRGPRPRLPRYFPPGYFDWPFWLTLVINLGGLSYIGYVAFQLVERGAPDGWLFFQCVCLASCVLTTARMARMLVRHSREWRTQDRPRLEQHIDEMDARMQAYAREFEEFMRNKNEEGRE